MLTENIFFKNFSTKSNSLKVKKLFKNLINENLPLLDPLKKKYKYSYTKKLVSSLKKFSNFRIIGMGGSALGTEAIYNFLKHKIKKKIIFANNLDVSSLYFFKKKKIKILI